MHIFSERDREIERVNIATRDSRRNVERQPLRKGSEMGRQRRRHEAKFHLAAVK